MLESNTVWGLGRRRACTNPLMIFMGCFNATRQAPDRKGWNINWEESVPHSHLQVASKLCEHLFAHIYIAQFRDGTDFCIQNQVSNKKFQDLSFRLKKKKILLATSWSFTKVSHGKHLYCWRSCSHLGIFFSYKLQEWDFQIFCQRAGLKKCWHMVSLVCTII